MNSRHLSRSVAVFFLCLTMATADDTTPPTIVETIPDLSKPIPVWTREIEIVFSEKMDDARSFRSNLPMGGPRWNEAKTTLYLSTGNLRPSTDYWIQIETSGNVFKDAAGNRLAPQRFAIRTDVVPDWAKADTTPPTIVRTLPNLSEPIPYGTKDITICFSEKMGPKWFYSFKRTGPRPGTTPTWNDDRTEITIHPGGLVPFRAIELRLNPSFFGKYGKRFQDLAGNILGSRMFVFQVAPSQEQQRIMTLMSQGKTVDADGDGLEDALETRIGTDPQKVDTDDDGLPDYEEYCKYRTDAADKDSDDDGLPDGHPDERREYTYTIKATMRLVEPFDVQTMNDLFQDVKVVKEGKSSTIFEVILYPEASPHLLPSKCPLSPPSNEMADYLRPGIAMNYSPEMQREVKQIAGSAETALQAIDNVIYWRRMNVTSPVATAHFVHVRIDNGKPVIVRPFKHRKYSDEQIMDFNFYAETMFKARKCGSCSSVATLQGAMFRALGVPTRLVQAVPLIYRYGKEGPGLLNNMRNKTMSKGFSIPEGRRHSANHVYNEVFLSGHWIRVDDFVNEKVTVRGRPHVKIASFGDWDELDFTKTWSYTGRPTDRPYRTLSLSDAYATHESVYAHTTRK